MTQSNGTHHPSPIVGYDTLILDSPHAQNPNQSNAASWITATLRIRSSMTTPNTQPTQPSKPYAHETPKPLVEMRFDQSNPPHPTIPWAVTPSHYPLPSGAVPLCQRCKDLVIACVCPPLPEPPAVPPVGGGL